ncbi:MAG: oligosaccharide flippase family protein [Bacteroidota bacterium]
MIDKIIQKAKTHKSIIENFSYLSALQVFNMILPLITYPYLISVLGKETYGLVIFAQAIIGYLLILVNFGFNISATREISIHRDNQVKLNEIISSILIIKGILFFCSLIILSVLMYILPQAHGVKILFYLSMYLCLYEWIFPVWYFQGIEKMKYITFITLISRLIFLALIFLLIQSSEDYLFLPIINGIGAIIAGILSLYIVFFKHKIQFHFQSVRILFKYFKGSTPIFISNVSIGLYVSTNKVLIGTFLGMGEVAYYDLAEKVVSILKIPQVILGQVLFPKISKDQNIVFVKKIFKTSIIVNSLLFICTIFFSKPIVLFLGGDEMLPVIPVLVILGITVPIIGVSNIFGVQLLIPFGFYKDFTRVILLSGVFYCLQVLLLWLSFGFTLYSISIVTVVTEIFVTAYMFYLCKKNRLW